MPWRLIDENTPRDRRLWIYWPVYHCPTYGDDAFDVVALAEWKHNGRMTGRTPAENPDGLSDHYWSDIFGEYDDYGLGHPAYQPTHWRPYYRPAPPPIAAEHQRRRQAEKDAAEAAQQAKIEEQERAELARLKAKFET